MITGVLALLGALFPNSRNQVVIEVKLDELSKRVEKRNLAIERQYLIERRISILASEFGRTRKAE